VHDRKRVLGSPVSGPSTSLPAFARTASSC
jgi:hypothetical protein